MPKSVLILVKRKVFTDMEDGLVGQFPTRRKFEG